MAPPALTDLADAGWQHGIRAHLPVTNSFKVAAPQRGTARSVLVRFVDGVLGAVSDPPVAISSANPLLSRSASAAGAGTGASRACAEARTGGALSTEIE